MIQSKESTLSSPSKNALLNCLNPLLDTLGWRGERVTLFEAMPEKWEEITANELKNILKRLDFRVVTKAKKNYLPKRSDLPCLYIKDHTHPYVLMRPIGQQLLVYDGKNAIYTQIPFEKISGTFFYISNVNTQLYFNIHTIQDNWFLKLIKKHKRYLFAAISFSLIISILALLPPLFISVLYSAITLRSSSETMLGLGFGVLIYLVAFFGIRHLRSLLMSELSIQIGENVSHEVLRRILYLPPSYTEMASLSSQISRIKDFDSVREFLSGPLFSSLLEIPFLIILLLALFIMNFHMAIVVILSMLLFIILGFITIPLIKKSNLSLSDAGKNSSEFLLETFTNIRDVKFSGAIDIWSERYKHLCAQQAINSMEASHLDATVSHFSAMIVSITGVMTLLIGILNVMENKFASSILISVMFLVWRILAPIKTLFNIITQLGRTRRSIHQLDHFMTLSQENQDDQNMKIHREFNGDIKFQNIFIRYTPDAIPALLNVSFHLPSGKTMAIMGHGHSGKSTLLKLILGLYTPQAGRVLLDDLNIRQLDPLRIRRSISYLPQQVPLFSGTIEQNIKMANPLVSDKNYFLALEKTGLDLLLKKLPQGDQTLINYSTAHTINFEQTKLIGLSRVFLRSSSIILLDDPFSFLTDETKEIIFKNILELKGMATIIFTNTDEQFLTLSDVELYLDRGKTDKLIIKENHT